MAESQTCRLSVSFNWRTTWKLEGATSSWSPLRLLRRRRFLRSLLRLGLRVTDRGFAGLPCPLQEGVLILEDVVGHGVVGHDSHRAVLAHGLERLDPAGFEVRPVAVVSPQPEDVVGHDAHHQA